MKPSYALVLSAVIITSGIATSQAIQPDNTIESCASLLPEGHEFTLNIEGEINTKLSPRMFNGNLGLSDGTNIEDPELQKSVMPFIECVSPLLK
ncbi:hypothetical protein L4C38_04230 [Vibrio kasasachensis]|uniref:hypothetical protein n=1 Tax=Vibrio kasasachensis TaxID=2910248 RepID=UPI003D0A8BAB